MLDNYAEEFFLLNKLLRTKAFRFVIVRYNHFSLVKQLEKDLHASYPDRSIHKVNAETVQFSDLYQSYLDLNQGILWVENFGNILKDQTTSTGEVTEVMQKENERRHSITSGLNLRRDKLAKLPNTLILFVAASPNDLFLRIMMEKMPDLWSFRSLFLDLEMERQISPNEKIIRTEEELDLSHREKNEKEIRRLQKSLATATPEDISLKLSIYPQLTRLLADHGIYDQAIELFNEWLELADETAKGEILFDKGDVLKKQGKISLALVSFEQALLLSQKDGNRNREGLCHERIGDIQSDLGNLEKAMQHFLQYEQIEENLVKEFPDESLYKSNLAISYLKLGDIQSSLGNLEKALEYFEEYNRLKKELYDLYPQNVSFKNGLAISYLKLGDIQSSLGNLEKALEYFEIETKLFEELYDLYPQNVSFKNGLAISYEKLGSTQSTLGNLEKALEYFEERSKLGKELYDLYPQNVSFKNSLAISYEKLGETQSTLGNLEKALEYFEIETKLFEELYDLYPQNVSFKNGLAISYEKLGKTQSTLGNLEKALEYFEIETKLFEELYDLYPQNVSFKNGLAISYSKLGRFYRDKQKDKKQAKHYFKLCYKLWEGLAKAYPTYQEFQNNFRWIKETLEELK